MLREGFNIFGRTPERVGRPRPLSGPRRRRLERGGGGQDDCRLPLDASDCFHTNPRLLQASVRGLLADTQHVPTKFRVHVATLGVLKTTPGVLFATTRCSRSDTPRLQTGARSCHTNDPRTRSELQSLPLISGRVLTPALDAHSRRPSTPRNDFGRYPGAIHHPFRLTGPWRPLRMANRRERVRCPGAAARRESG